MPRQRHQEEDRPRDLRRCAHASATTEDAPPQWSDHAEAATDTSGPESERQACRRTRHITSTDMMSHGSQPRQQRPEAAIDGGRGGSRTADGAASAEPRPTSAPIGKLPGQRNERASSRSTTMGHAIVTEPTPVGIQCRSHDQPKVVPRHRAHRLPRGMGDDGPSSAHATQLRRDNCPGGLRSCTGTKGKTVEVNRSYRLGRLQRWVLLSARPLRQALVW